ncbi:glycosyltransferase family 2 protein [Kitasatospora sp. NPDC088346]|uniref:glycosyltransferase family 2 protein n=1 Tax=Kitasatospora sp. NPDC088346 TaxID=3364073 RepID=UPI0037FA47E3
MRARDGRPGAPTGPAPTLSVPAVSVPAVSVLTACRTDRAGTLPDALASLEAQHGTDWEWVLQFDGPVPVLPPSLLAARAGGLLSVGGSARPGGYGPAEARNRGLARCRGELVQNLDADDELEPDALTLLADALRARPDAAYAVGDARDLLPDGSLVSVALDLRPGLLAPGEVYLRWRTEPSAYSVPLHPAGVMWRRSVLLEFGGWPALWGMDDTALLMAVSAVRPGVYVGADTLRYRRHDGQLSFRVARQRDGLGDQVTMVRQRVAALRRRMDDGLVRRVDPA